MALATLAFCGAFYTLNQSISHKNMSDTAYYSGRMMIRDQFNVIFAGDSRTQNGIAPQVVGQYLPEASVLNFGFGGCGWDTSYLDRIGDLLVADGQKVLVLGITPYSLTPNAIKDNMFLSYSEQHTLSLRLSQLSGNLSLLFSPINLRRMAAAMTGGYHKQTHYHKNGWKAVIVNPENPLETLKTYRKLFKGNTASAEIEKLLLARVARWTAQGITVAAYRPPTTSKMVELENDMSRWDEAAFRKRFETAGGIWYSFSNDVYASYDGSHLNRTAAETFSRDVARKLASRGGSATGGAAP